MEQIVGLNSGADDLTALGAMKKGGKIVSVGYTVYCCYVVVWKPLFCEIPHGGAMQAKNIWYKISYLTTCVPHVLSAFKYVV